MKSILLRRPMRYAGSQEPLAPMTETTDRSLTHLSQAAGRLGGVLARPKWLAGFCIIAITGLGWLWLALLISGMGGPSGALGPGMGALDLLPRLFAAACQPTFGLSVLAMPGADWGLMGFVVVGLMWAAMVLAMMLPSAGPMIFTYAEIADTAAGKGEPIVTPFVLAAGYTVVWLGFAALATLVQYGFTKATLLDDGMASASGLFSGAIFVAAGFYQFSALKHACLRQCQSPFPFFFANWETTDARRVPAGHQAGDVLPRLLLGHDGGDVRGRHHERHLDGGARHRHDRREDADRHPLQPRHGRADDHGRGRLHRRGLCRALACLEHDPEKWEPVFGKDHAQTKC